MVLLKLGLHVQKNETGPLFQTIYRKQIRRVENLNVKPETVKLLGKKKHKKKLLGIGLGKDFSVMITIA